MDWLTEYFDILLPVALVLFFLFQRMFARDEGEGVPPGEPSEAEAEARRIQEEIRRKIIARQQGRTEEAEEPAFEEFEREGPVVFPRRHQEYEERPPVVQQPPPVRRSQPEPRPTVSTGGPRRDIQEELRIQKERLEESRRAKAEAVRRTSRAGLPAAERVAQAHVRREVAGDLRAQLFADLATADSMKRAFLLKEVVDRPVGLRSRPDVFSNWS